jgi:hypothetical protein
MTILFKNVCVAGFLEIGVKLLNIETLASRDAMREIR